MANRARWRGPRWERASKEERLLLLAGVPSRYWAEPDKLPHFLGFEFTSHGGKPVKLLAKRQRAAYEALLNDSQALLEAGLVVIGTKNTDNQAMQAAIDLVRPYLVARVRATAKIVDLGSVPALDDMDSEGENIGRPWWREAEEACCRIYHNILPESADDRLELLRDMITAASETTHIVVVAGENPIDFAYERLRMDADVAFYTDGRSTKESR